MAIIGTIRDKGMSVLVALLAISLLAFVASDWIGSSNTGGQQSQKMKIIAVIPARYASTRFPAKLLQDLGGKTVILRTYEAMVATNIFDDVIVVTDSNTIYDEIVNNGGKAMMSIKEHDCGSDRIAEAVEFLDIDIVINVQGDEPAINTNDIISILKYNKLNYNIIMNFIIYL